MAIVRFDALRTKGFAAITNAYTTVGTALTRNWKIFKITNNTNGDMFFSADGSIDNLYVPAGSFTLYDLSTNAAPVQESDTFVMGIGTQFYVKYDSAPTSGSVWIEALYAQGV